MAPLRQRGRDTLRVSRLVCFRAHLRKGILRRFGVAVRDCQLPRDLVYLRRQTGRDWRVLPFREAPKGPQPHFPFA